MARPTKLADEEIHNGLEALPDWKYSGGKLHREYRFIDFTHAFGFMAAAATAIEAMNHHPDWSNVYGKVTVELSTHDAGGVTQLDLDLAAKLDALAKKLL
jgi:4a-hydroxytetrahydrobiopterin dehydratase